MDLKPEFSWIVPQKAKAQSAYQILVASSKQKLKENNADVWNSQKITSRKSSEVELECNNLTGNKTYFWKVRIWNNRNIPTKYSEIQSFTTGNPEGYSTTSNRFQTAFIQPVNFVKISDKYYFADFGKDAFGTMVLELSPLTADTIIVHLGENACVDD